MGLSFDLGTVHVPCNFLLADMKILPIIFTISTLILVSSCQKGKEPRVPTGGTVLVPITKASNKIENNQEDSEPVNNTALPLVNPGSNYNTLAIYDVNLDTETSDEQILLAIPLDEEDAPMELMIARAQSASNEYEIVWREKLHTRILTGINLRTDDITGNGRDDIVVTGFNEIGHHATAVFSIEKDNDITDFRLVFNLSVKGNIDVVSVERSPDYFSGVKAGIPYTIVVQTLFPESENELDLIETTWHWEPSQFTYLQGKSQLLKGKNLIEKRLEEIYAGDVATYENHLRGSWYRESGKNAYEDILFFDPEKREIIFYNGTTLEVFLWGNSHRTTAKRLYSQIKNAVIPSFKDTLWISIENWDNIKLTRNFKDWNGAYRRLSTSLQTIIQRERALTPLLSDSSFTGVWENQSKQKILFDLPRIEWMSDKKTRIGTASILSIADTRVLQIQFLKDNGAVGDTENWIINYEQDGDNMRIIRSLTLSPAMLTVNGIRKIGTDFLHFEQIEVLSPIN